MDIQSLGSLLDIESGNRKVRNSLEGPGPKASKKGLRTFTPRQ